MDLGWVGLGKLGAPAFLAFAAAGHTMHGYDVSKKYEGYFEHGISLNEAGFEETLASTPRERLQFEKSISDVVAKSEIVFVAVQTPHSPQYEGTTIAPEHRKDFDYAFLTQAVRDIACAALEQDKHITIAIISTALPGSFNKHLRGLKNHRVTLVYNPFFIAMGTTIADVQRPEFVLIGVDTPKDALIMQDVYSKVHDRPLQVMSIEDAELTKVSYNTFISLKIVFANMLMEICHKTGADCDRVVDALSQATDRVISPKYLRGGMGDAGACFPPGQLVMTEHGPRAIESISAGDRVLSGDGTLRRVVRTWERDYSGDLLTMKSEGMPKIQLTANHRVFVAADGRPAKQGRKHYPVLGKTVADFLGEYREVPAEEVVAGTDHMAWPHVVEDIHAVAPEYVTPEYVELAGWYLAEGSIEAVPALSGGLRSGRVAFALHSDEVRERERIAELLLQVSPPRESGRGAGAYPSVVVDGNRASVRYGSALLCEKLLTDFGKGSSTKKLPSWILWGDEKWARLVLLGLFGGDGHVDDAGLSYTTTSVDLAYGVVVLLDRLGVPSTLTALHRPGKLPSYDVKVRNSLHIAALSEIVDMPCVVQRNGSIRFPDRGDGRLYRRVVSLESEHYEGVVHNLWVEGTHTYVTPAGTVSNCHPRDLIAMSHLAERLDLSTDLMGYLVRAREDQNRYIADLVCHYAELTGLDVVVLGRSYKPESKIETGSIALLLRDEIRDALPSDRLGKKRGVMSYDPHVSDSYCYRDRFHWPHVFVVATQHAEFAEAQFEPGSVVIDPFGYIKDQEGVTVVRVGRKN